jgi:formate hydrogenlyase subunit 3/multisubunit Na+/H+ antiporter MnhD subunit
MEMSAPATLGWFVIAPLAASIAAFLFGRRREMNLAIVALTAGVLAWVTGPAVTDLLRFGPLSYRLGAWGAPLGIELRLDGLSVVFLLTTLVVILAGSVHADGMAEREVDHAGPSAGGSEELARRRSFLPLWLLLWAGLDALFLSSDLFNLYVALELVGLCAVALVALAGGLSVLKAAMRYLFANAAASTVFLAGVALVYHQHQALDLATLSARVTDGTSDATALSLLSAGLAFKAALFPLHAWLPTAHASAVPPVSAVLSALVVKAPVYLLARLWLDVFWPVVDGPAFILLGALGAIGMVWGSSQAVRAERLKVLVAYSTVAQIGLLLAAFPIVARAGSGAWLGLVLLAAGHALAKAAMFLAAGGIAQVYGHDRLSEMTGFGARVPVCTYAFGLAGISLVGIPGTVGFLGKWLLATAGMAAAAAPWVATVTVSSLFTASYVWKVLAIAVRHVPAPAELAPLARRAAWPAFGLAVLTVVLGTMPGLVSTLAAVGLPGWVAGAGP